MYTAKMILEDFTNDLIRNMMTGKSKKRAGLIEDTNTAPQDRCYSCGAELQIIVISQDLDGNRPEYDYGCISCE